MPSADDSKTSATGSTPAPAPPAPRRDATLSYKSTRHLPRPKNESPAPTPAPTLAPASDPIDDRLYRDLLIGWGIAAIGGLVAATICYRCYLFPGP